MSHPSHHHSQDKKQPVKPITWKTPDALSKPKTAEWYWMFGIIGVSTAVAFAIVGNALFGLVVLLGLFAVALFSFKKTPSTEVEITNTGIRTDKILTPFKTLESFWIEEIKPQKKLLLKSQKTYLPLIVIPIQNINTEELRKNLSAHIKEEQLERSVFDEILEKVGI
jgi:hypothetical protein